MADSLPIDELLPRIVTSLRDHPNLVLRAPTGAGKTTRVAPALLDAGGKGTIALVEPRRMAARGAARRIASERGSRLGAEIGYSVRFDRKAGPATRILVMTSGIFVRMLQSDPFLEQFSTVIFDEFHERGMDLDLGLAMALKVQADVRPDLSIVAMSATLEPGATALHLGACPVLESRGRLHPVEMRYLGSGENVETAVARALPVALTETAGDVLVFLPGVGEIRRCARRLAPMAASQNLVLRELYGDLAPDKQDAVLRQENKRKVVLATNVAETSVTIENITAVIDSGLARTLRYDPSVALDRLELGRIARTSAVQRAGRAGRTSAGLCLRLWSEHDDRALAEHMEPEIRRADLSRLVLELRAWGETEIAHLPFLDPPDPTALRRAEDLLVDLGALSAQRPQRGARDLQLTPLGTEMVRLPVSPRIARMLIAGARVGVADRAALAAALLSERDPFRNGGITTTSIGQHSAWESDLLDRVIALESRPEQLPGSLRRARDQIRSLANGIAPADNTGASEPTSTNDPDESLLRALLAGFPDRVARRREPSSPRAVMVSGRGVELAATSKVATSELFLALDLEAGRRGERSEGRVRLASAIEPAWLTEVQTEDLTEFDSGSGSIRTVRRTMYRDLELTRKNVPTTDLAQAERLLVDAAAANLETALPLKHRDVAYFLARVRCAASWMPELGLPAFDRPVLEAMLPTLAAGKRSFAEFNVGEFLGALEGTLTFEQRRSLDRHTPSTIEVPSGRRVPIEYSEDGPPVVAARIQEFFGAAETPRIARDRVAILIHLLAPNGRPQQITDDLASFWNTTYKQVRAELRARYSKHSWPDDPSTATPERRPSRRKGKAVVPRGGGK